jgi:D-alanyl-D-alanine carboxypeptidase
MPIIRRIAVFACALTALVQSVNADSASASSLDHVVSGAAANGFSGVVAVSDQSAVIYSRATGLADRALQKPHEVSAPWRLASFTKQVVATLAMQEVDKGRLKLDAPIAQTLLALSATPAGQVTLRQLLQHTSGLPNPDAQTEASDAVPAYYRTLNPPVPGTVPSACIGDLLSAPGEQFSYNNCDYLVVSAMIEHVTASTLPRLIETRIARPAGARGLGIYRTADDGPRGVIGYDDKDTVEPAFHIENYGGAGALYGTPDDVLAFDRHLMAGRLVTKASRTMLWRGEPRFGFAALGAWSFEATLAGCPKPVQLVERRGEVGGIQLRNVLAPELGLALVALTNSQKVSFGEVWQGQGLLHDLLSAAFCGPVVTQKGASASRR